MVFPLPLAPAQRKDSLSRLAAGSILTLLWAAALATTPNLLVQCGAFGLALTGCWLCRSTLNNGLASIVILGRFDHNALTSLAAIIGIVYGFTVTAAATAGHRLVAPLADQPAAPLYYYASAVSILALRHFVLVTCRSYSSLRDDEPLVDASARNSRVVFVAGVGLPAIVVIFLALISPSWWGLHGMAGTLALALAFSATVVPDSFRNAARVLRRLTREYLPASEVLTPSALSEIDWVVVERSDVITTNQCEIREVLSLDASRTEDDVLHLAAVSEYAVTPNPIRQAILRRVRSALRTVPRIKTFRHEPGRGVAAQYNGQELIFGNLEWLEEKGWEPAELERIRGETSTLYGRGETVLYVGLSRKTVGAVSLYVPRHPEADSFFSSLRSLGIGIKVISGDTPDTVETMLSNQKHVEVRAGLRPEERIEFLENLRRAGNRVALVARSGSPIFPEASALVDVTFEISRRDDTLKIANPSGRVVKIDDSSLDQVAHTIQVSRRLVEAERRGTTTMRLYHSTLLPVVIMGTLTFADWKLYPVLGILTGVLSTWLALPGRGAFEPRRRSASRVEATPSEAALVAAPPAGSPESVSVDA